MEYPKSLAAALSDSTSVASREVYKSFQLKHSYHRVQL